MAQVDVKYCPHCGSRKIEERCSPTFYCPGCGSEFDIWDLSGLEEGEEPSPTCDQVLIPEKTTKLIR